MQIRQVVILADVSSEAKGVLSELEKLGLDISDTSSNELLGEISSLKDHEITDRWSERLVICNSDFGSTTADQAVFEIAMKAAAGILSADNNLGPVLEEVRETGGLKEVTRKSLAAKALYRSIDRDAKRLESLQGDSPQYLAGVYEKVQTLRYGENWHQQASLYRRPDGIGLHLARKLQGREISYNNVVDAEATLEMILELSEYDGVEVDRPLCVIVKHTNPCGVAYGKTQEEAYRLAFATDPKSAFGGVIGFSKPVDEETALAIGDSFVEVLLAPGFEPEALEILKRKPNRRILDIGDLLHRSDELYSGLNAKLIFGGLLVQDYDTQDIKEWKVVTKRKPTSSETRAMRFAWKVCKYVKSNAFVYATESQTIGIGSGQVSRVDSARFGAEKAKEHGLDTRGTAAATDSFFPFRDGLDEAFEAGATAVVHPGGSIRDEEVIDAADEHGMAMVFTGMRHFRH
jgi:phosphoribosylaminoimidazolecarboxamide formyltransferase/IMP cyclohydrolase